MKSTKVLRREGKKRRLSQLNSRDVGEVECCRGREDVRVIFGAGLLEAVQRGVAVVLGQALVLVAFSGQLHAGVFGRRDAQRLPVQLLSTQVAHGCRGGRSKVNR